jgi:ligand-binding sensor domain-containing protein
MKDLIKIIILFLLLKINLFSQNYSYRIFNNKDDYNSQETMSVFYDSRGFLWAGGVDGLTRYDGLKFTHYDKSDGLIDNEIQGISEDSKHNLWISTINGISYFDGNKFSNYNHTFIDTSYKKPYFINVFETSKGITYACSATGLYKLNKSKKEFKQLSDIKTYVSDIAEDKNGTIWISTSLALYKLKNNLFEKIDLQPIIDYNTATCLAFDKKQQLWIGTTKGILKYDGKKFAYYFSELKSNHNIKDLIVTSDSSIVFSSATPEIKIYKNGNFKTLSISKEIGNVDIQHLVEDKEGNIWLAAINLIKMYKKPLFKYYLSDTINAITYSINSDKNTMYFATDKGLKIVNDTKIETIYPDKKQDNKIITALCKIDSSLLIGTYSGAVFKFYKNKFYPFDTTSVANDIVYNILNVNSNEYWFTKNTKVTHYLKGKSTYYLLSEPISAPTQNCIIDSDKTIWFANIENLTTYKDGVLKKVGSKEGFNYKAPVTILEDKNHIIWIGTYGDGLVKYDKKTFKNITSKNGLVHDYISSSFYDKQNNTIWIGTGNGISKILLDEHSNISFIKNYVSNEDNLSLSCNQNSIYKLENGNILFGCGNQLIEYNSLFDNGKTIVLPLYFEGLRLNYEKTDWLNFTNNIISWTNMPTSLELPYNKNHLTFDFTAICFNDPKNIKYQWKLLNNESNWSPESKNNYATFSNISCGTYTFCVRAKTSNGNWSTPITYSFTIKPPFYKTWWFISLILLSSITCIYLFIKTRIIKIKKEEQLKTESYKKLAEVELKAMRAQMNPHFMFNTLNSIQEIVLNKDDETARIYLADFALMMRMILENSTQKTITLEKEIEFIELYLRLEVLRFENKFKVTLLIPETLSLNSINVPPMLIQPYIENAIIHGLMHKTQDGILNISFEITLKQGKDFLKCTITDNGVGRKKSAELEAWKGKKHQSMATEITNERLQLLNNINSIKGYQVIIIDLENENKDSLGTKVEIYIPLN